MTDFFNIIKAGLRLDPTLWRDLLANPDAIRFQYAFFIVILAGLSEALAQSLVLFMSRVRQSRFFISLLLNALLLAISYLFYVVSIEFLAETVFGKAPLNALAFKMIALTYAPYIFAMITLMPYFGKAFSLYIEIYHFFVLLVAVTVSYGFSPTEGALCLAASWLLIQIFKNSLGRPITKLTKALKNRAAGTSLMTQKELKQYYADLLGKKPNA